LSSRYPRSGRGGNRFGRETRTSLYPATLSATPGRSQGVPRPEGIYNPSSKLWVYAGASSQLDVPEKPPKGGDQEAS